MGVDNCGSRVSVGVGEIRAVSRVGEGKIRVASNVFVGGGVAESGAKLPQDASITITKNKGSIVLLMIFIFPFLSLG